MPDGATLIRPTSGSRIGLCLMALRLSGLHLATSGSRVGRIRRFAAIQHYSINDAPESRNNSCENSARRHRETH
ncbi:hypothetical protein EIL18_10875 [Salmonella enterica subsp. enterica]|nr:hypothetical protein [Salmonella enterica subsp. enterica]EGX3497772.1 hypothetical protein [Salmonella enterica]